MSSDDIRHKVYEGHHHNILFVDGEDVKSKLNFMILKKSEMIDKFS